MNKSLLWTVLLGFGFAFPSCQTLTGKFSETPYLEIIEVSPLEPEEFRDSIIFTLFYRDGDGDLGENQADVENLFLVDQRNGLEYGYRIPALAPQGAEVAIQGTLKVALEWTLAYENQSKEGFAYTVFVKDRAGNESNRVESEVLIVRPFVRKTRGK